MKSMRLAGMVCAAYLLLSANAHTHRAAARVQDFSAAGRVASAALAEPRALLHGERLFTIAGYELNASFTPGGEFFCFELRAVGAKH